MGKSSANDVCGHFKSCTETLKDTKYLQVSWDDLYVNLAFLDILSEAGSNAYVGKKLLDQGHAGYTKYIMHSNMEKMQVLRIPKTFECLV